MAAPGHSEQVDTLILGAGLAGMSCALHLKDAARYRLIERSAQVGGLARSETRDGFVFDITGHWFHSRDPEIRALVDDLLDGQLLQVERNAGIHLRGRYFPYPFQANLAALPEAEKARCLSDLIDARYGETGERRRAEAASFEDWMRAHLGDGIADAFMVPYNQKLWTVPPSEMRAGFTRRFVPVPDVEQVVRGTLGAAQQHLGYNARFSYPASGGIGALPTAMAARLPRAPDFEVEPVAVDLEARSVELSDGRRLSYRQLVSSIPLDALTHMLGDAPASVREAAAALKHNRVTYFNVGLRAAPSDAEKAHRRLHWIYFAEPEFNFYRVGAPSAAVSSLCPEGSRSLYVELAHQEDIDVDAAREEVIEGLLRADLLDSREDLLFADAREIPHAYVIPDAQYDGAREQLFEFYAGAGVELIGRYGRWDYTSMEDAIRDGRDAARRILAA